MQVVRIKLKSMDIKTLNEICDVIISIVKNAGMAARGPIPLPTKVLKITTRKSPCGSGTETFDRFEMRIHKRVIDLGLDERALRYVMRVPIPDGVNISIGILE